MDITCISDLHGHFPKLSGGDLLIIAGDLTASDSIYEHAEFQGWISQQNYRKKIFIGGNHDNNLDSDFSWDNENTAEYLCDSGTEFGGLKIFGSPWTKRFPKMNPKCMAFTVDTEEELADKFQEIPDDVDILITHSPPFGILDNVEDYTTGKIKSVGSKYLRGALEYVFRPKLWVVAHIHEGYGQVIFRDSCTIVNASHVNEHYEPVNKPIRIEL